MGFLVYGFTSSKHNCFVSWIFMMFEGLSTLFAMYSYAFLWLYIFSGSNFPDIEYFALIGAVTHICVCMFLFLTDIYFKSDMMYFAGSSESTTGNVTTVTSFGSFETNPQIQVEEDNEYSCHYCLQQNPWALYRKHYVVVTIKIIFLILDIVVLCVFNDGWKCAKMDKC